MQTRGAVANAKDRVPREHRDKQSSKRGAHKAGSLRAGSERVLRELEISYESGITSVQDRVEDLNEQSKAVTPTTGTPAASLNTYTKGLAPSASDVATPPPLKPHPSKRTPGTSISDVSMAFGDGDKKAEQSRDDKLISMMTKMSEENTRAGQEIREELKEMRLSREKDQERMRKDKESVEAQIGELEEGVGELRRCAVVRRDLDEMMAGFKESQERILRDMTASTQAWAKRSADDKNEVHTGMETLKKQLGELQREFEYMRTYPIQNENRTNAQIMSIMTQYENVQRNVLIRGIPEHDDMITDQEQIKDELWNDFRVISRCKRDPIKSVQRLGKRYDDQRFPRMVKVSFESLGIRDDFLRESRELDEEAAVRWKAWKEAHPTDFLEEHDDKPRFRKYFSDTPNLIRSKKRELQQVCQLLPIAGPSGMNTPVMVDLPNGDAKLILCSRAEDGKWISEASGVEAETMATDYLRDYAIRKGWKTRANTSYTSAGAFLPLPGDIVRDPTLKGIFSSEITKTRMENVVRSRDLKRAVAVLDSAVNVEMRNRMGEEEMQADRVGRGGAAGEGGGPDASGGRLGD